MKVFSKEKYIKETKRVIRREKDKLYKTMFKAMFKSSLKESEWVTYCDGKEVIDGHIEDMYQIRDEWCIEKDRKEFVAEEVEKKFKEIIDFIGEYIDESK
jgi:hypothetical protein